jgi:hypothetical protein
MVRKLKRMIAVKPWHRELLKILTKTLGRLICLQGFQVLVSIFYVMLYYTKDQSPITNLLSFQRYEGCLKIRSLKKIAAFVSSTVYQIRTGCMKNYQILSSASRIQITSAQE